MIFNEFDLCTYSIRNVFHAVFCNIKNMQVMKFSVLGFTILKWGGGCVSV